MGYYVSHMIGIKTAGVFDGPFTPEGYAEFKARVEHVVRRLQAQDEDEAEEECPFGIDVADASHCLSHELTAAKGGFVVIAGVFNYRSFEEMAELAAALSKEFETAVMHMCWDEMTGSVNCQVWQDGATEG